MSTLLRTARNLATLTMAQLFVRLGSLVIAVFLGRHLGPADFGRYSLALSFAGMFAMLGRMGTTQIFLRDVAENPALGPKMLGMTFLLRIPQNLLAIAVTLTAAVAAGYRDGQLLGIGLMAFVTAGQSFESLWTSVMEAAERIHFEAIHLAIRQTLWMILCGLLIWLGRGYLSFLWAQLAVALAAIAVSTWIVFHWFYRPLFAMDLTIARRLLRAGIPVAAASLVFDFYMKIGLVLVERSLGPDAAGMYGASYRILVALTAFSTSFFAVVYPIFSRLQAGDSERLMLAYTKSLKAIILLLAPMSAGISALSVPIIHLVWGTHFSSAASVLVILAWVPAVQGISVILGRLLMAQNHYDVFLGINLAGLATNLGVTFFMIPRVGAAGAAIGSVCTEIVVSLLNWYILGRYRERPPLFRVLWRIYLSAIVMGVVVGKFIPGGLLVQVPAGIVIYVGLILSLRAFNSEDRTMLAKIITALRGR